MNVIVVPAGGVGERFARLAWELRAGDGRGFASVLEEIDAEVLDCGEVFVGFADGGGMSDGGGGG